jgi:3-phenylpropionate/cinnamic acid dioxygenase small subunit
MLDKVMSEETMTDAVRQAAERLLFLEAHHLDQKEWHAWAKLYEPDAEYWVPAWLDEYEIVDNPKTQISLIYHTSRTQLEERIGRIQSRKSITALPLPRTLHMISNILVSMGDDGAPNVRACWTTHVYDPRTCKQYLHFGTYEYRLSKSNEQYRIARKKITVMNDRIPTILDFYSV